MWAGAHEPVGALRALDLLLDFMTPVKASGVWGGGRVALLKRSFAFELCLPPTTISRKLQKGGG